MSNVLIGIIGVILFIGLALAGALFLGPRFQESTNNSKASAAVQAVSQIASAANMAQVQNGSQTVTATSTSALVTSGYLKSVPSNPMTGAPNAGVPFLTDTTAYTTDGSRSATLVAMNLGTTSGAVCLAIARQTGRPATTDADLATGPSMPSGCIKLIANVAGMATGDYVAYSTL
jgi:type II secretory pathway pseudopilin PulG